MSAKLIYFFLVCICVVCIVNGTDYCDMKGCELGKYVMCLYPDNTTSDSCGNVSASGINDFNQRSLVDAINTYRRVNSRRVNNLAWDVNLAKLAQKWANQCTTSELPSHCSSLSEQTSIHHQVYKGPDAALPYQVVGHWNRPEDKIFNPPYDTEYEVINQVGCGRIVGSEGNYLVCNFRVIW